MVTESETNKENCNEKKQHPMFHTARKVLLASIGAMSLAQDEAEEFIHHLIERGEIAEKDGKDLMHEIRDRRKAKMQEAEERFHKRFTAMLDRMNIPAQKDIQELNEKIADLTRKVEELKKLKD